MTLAFEDRASAGLTNPRGLIDGEWCAGDSDLWFDVVNPATAAVIARVPRMGREETARAVGAAQRAWMGWRSRTADERGLFLMRWADLIQRDREQIARVIVLEHGKPLAEARVELDYAASFLVWFAEEGKRTYGEIVSIGDASKRAQVFKQSMGVGGAITPWNFPAAMITRKAAPALAAGCTLVLKPAEQTPLTAVALVALAQEAGIPPGVLNLVLGASEDAPEIGLVLTTHPDVRKVSFTGSTEVGSILMAQAAPTVKSVALELGGNAPFIVFDDADLDRAVEGLVACKFRNAGQTCISANRILLSSAVHDDFVDRFVSRVRDLKVGDGMDANVDVGPLIDSEAVAKVLRHIERAEAGGAKVLHGGKPHELGGTFFTPTVVVDAGPEAMPLDEETFGPVAFISRFNSEEEAIERANMTAFGLSAYFYSQDADRIWRVSEALESGIVGVNTGVVSTAAAPFGGFKSSGLGREGSRHGIDDWLEMKYVCHAIN